MCSYFIVENSKPTEGSGRHLLSASLRPENTYSAYIISCNPHKNFIPNIIELNLLELELGFRLPNPRCSGDLVPTSYYKSQVGEKPLPHSFHLSWILKLTDHLYLVPKVAFRSNSNGHLVSLPITTKASCCRSTAAFSLMSINTLCISSSSAFAKQVACSSQEGANISPKGSTNLTPLSSLKEKQYAICAYSWGWVEDVNSNCFSSYKRPW